MSTTASAVGVRTSGSFDEDKVARLKIAGSEQSQTSAWGSAYAVAMRWFREATGKPRGCKESLNHAFAMGAKCHRHVWILVRWDRQHGEIHL